MPVQTNERPDLLQSLPCAFHINVYEPVIYQALQDQAVDTLQLTICFILSERHSQGYVAQETFSSESTRYISPECLTEIPFSNARLADLLKFLSHALTANWNAVMKRPT